MYPRTDFKSPTTPVVFPFNLEHRRRDTRTPLEIFTRLNVSALQMPPQRVTATHHRGDRTRSGVELLSGKRRERTPRSLQASRGWHTPDPRVHRRLHGPNGKGAPLEIQQGVVLPILQTGSETACPKLVVTNFGDGCVALRNFHPHIIFVRLHEENRLCADGY